MTSESADHPAAASGPEPVPAPPPSRRPAVGPVLVALAVGIGVAGSFPLWRDQAGFPAPESGFEVENLRAEVSALTARLAQMEAKPVAPVPAATSDEARLAALEQAVKAAHTQPSAPAILAADLESLAKQLAELKRSAADAATLLRLADRVEQTESTLRELQARRSSAAALLLAVGQLREAVNLGLVFDAEWRAVKVLAGDDAALAGALDAIRDGAASGIRGRSALAHEFEALAPRLIRAEILPDEDGWQRRVADRMLSLVSVRREDGQAAGGSAAAVVARAQAALTRGDLAAAVAGLDGLDAGPAQAAAPWLAEARARLAADKAISELAAQSLALAGARP